MSHVLALIWRFLSTVAGKKATNLESSKLWACLQVTPFPSTTYQRHRTIPVGLHIGTGPPSLITGQQRTEEYLSPAPARSAGRLTWRQYRSRSEERRVGKECRSRW